MFDLPPGFGTGFIFGFVVAGILAFFYDVSRRWTKTIQAYRKPQPVIHMTKKSPAEVARDAASARTRRTLLWTSVVVVTAILVDTALFNNYFLIFIYRLLMNFT